MPLQQLRVLLEKHCITLQNQIAEFEHQHRLAISGAVPARQAMDVLHSLKGSSGTMGFSDIHDRVVALETHLCDPGTAGVPDLDGEADRRIEELKALIGRVRPQQSRHYNLPI